MTILRGRALFLSGLCAVTISACGGKAEPDIPTFNPMEKVLKSEGWKIDTAIAASPGKDTPSLHHVQAIASGLHDVDFKTPPSALIPVKPSCKVTRPDISSGKYLIIGGGAAKFPLMKRPEIPGLVTFSNATASALAKKQANRMADTGRRAKPTATRPSLPAHNMLMKDVFITETSKPIVVALAGGGLYNFHLAPGVRLNGVVVYTGETGYNKSSQAAVAGVPDNVPVNFISETHKATKRCWTRIQNRPDKSWSKSSQKGRRFAALKPHWNTFFRRVKKDIDTFPEKNVISVATAGHYLIGPAPVKYEDRIPYVAFAGKSIRYMDAENVSFGTREQNLAFSRKTLDQFYEGYLAASAK